MHEFDNVLLVKLIIAGKFIDSHIMELRTVHKLIQRNWKVCIHHILRVHNEVADFMVKHALRFTSIQVFFEPPQTVRGLVQTDIMGC